MNTSEKFAMKLRVLREVNNYTQEYVAHVLDVSPNTYSLLEKGEGNFSIERMEKLANLYKMTLADLINFSGQNFFGTITNSNGICSETVNVHSAGVADEERKLYKETIARLEDQNNKLLTLLEKLSGKFEMKF